MGKAVEVTLYTRAECPLCDKAKAAIRDAEKRHGLDIVLREVDVDYDLALLEQFDEHVPVVYIEGREAFRHRVDAEEFASVVRTR